MFVVTMESSYNNSEIFKSSGFGNKITNNIFLEAKLIQLVNNILVHVRCTCFILKAIFYIVYLEIVGMETFACHKNKNVLAAILSVIGSIIFDDIF